MIVVGDGEHAIVTFPTRGRAAVVSGASGGTIAGSFPGTNADHYAVSPDGRHLVVAGRGFRVFTLPDCEEVVTYDVTPLQIDALAFRPGTTRFYTGHPDGSILIWDLAKLVE